MAVATRHAFAPAMRQWIASRRYCNTMTTRTATRFDCGFCFCRTGWRNGCNCGRPCDNTKTTVGAAVGATAGSVRSHSLRWMVAGTSEKTTENNAALRDQTTEQKRGHGSNSTGRHRSMPASPDRHNRWNEMYRRLFRYKDRVGHANVPQHYRTSEKDHHQKLGKWLDKQRQLKAQGTLDAGREELLEDLGVAWDVQSWKWDKMFRLLARYQAEHGHANVPQNYTVEVRTDKADGGDGDDDRHGEASPSSANLGGWLKDLRQLKLEGRLDPIRQEKLEGLGVVWDMHSWRWNHMFRLLVRYRERRGPSSVNTMKQSHKENGENLGRWCSRQRESFKKGDMDPERIAALEEIGFAWTVAASNKARKKKKNSAKRTKK